MFKNYDKRGSVLLMVVGLLVILGTLGGTFLLVSSLDARQSKLLAGRGKAELIASGGVGKVVRILGEDLHFAPGKTSAPYTAANITGDNRYKNFMDFASDTVDRHLHGDGHPSNVLGTSGILVSTETRGDDPGAQDDAYLVPTGEFSDDGEQYYIAVKVVDASSLLSLNTGGYDYIRGVPDTSKIMKSPALIRLKEWMDRIKGGAYTGIHNARCGVGSGGVPRTLTVYDAWCGRRLLSPEPNHKYMPFAIADEVYLRWLGSGTKGNFGRVYELISNSALGTSIANRRMLTTYNSSRSLTRSPLSGVSGTRVDLSKVNALNSDAKNGLYTQLVLIAGSDDGKGGGIPEGNVYQIDNSGTGFYRGNFRWLPAAGVPNAVNSNCTRNYDPNYQAWWVFANLPEATYRVWVSWGTAPNNFPGGSIVPYKVYTGGVLQSGMMASTYKGGSLKGTYVADQSVLPSDKNINGQRWQALGSHPVTGQLVVEIHGPQVVPGDARQYAYADAVRLEGLGVDLGSGSQPAAHLVANAWATMSEYQTHKAFAFKPSGKNWTVFGVQEQPFITEAFATHTTRTQNTDGTWVENSWKWGAAIELMNSSSRPIVLKDYALVFGSTLNKNTAVQKFPAGYTIPAGTTTKGGKLVIYDFDTGKGATTPSDVFGSMNGTWKRFEGLNFDNKTIRLVRVADGHKIPIDHVVADLTDKGNLKYGQPTDEVKGIIVVPGGKTTSANCRRDDSMDRHRYAVAKYWKKGPTEGPIAATSHRLGQTSNQVTLTGGTSIPESTLKQGFWMKFRHGLLSGPGELSDLYLAGPIIYDDASSPPADLPELLAEEYATEESRGRANSYVENAEFLDQKPWNTYPRKPVNRTEELAWPLLLGEVVETVTMDTERGDSPTRIYGRININTASLEVLKQLPWPNGINTGTAAGRIIAYRNSKGGFVTPGEVTLALDNLVVNAEKSRDFNRDSIYAAISGCITVNSDIYAVTVRVQLGSSKKPPADRSWYYLAVIDRGCAVFSTDKPAVLLFTKVR